MYNILWPSNIILKSIPFRKFEVLHLCQFCGFRWTIQFMYIQGFVQYSLFYCLVILWPNNIIGIFYLNIWQIRIYRPNFWRLKWRLKLNVIQERLNILYLRHYRAQTLFKNYVLSLKIATYKRNKKLILAWNLRGVATNQERPIMARVR